LAKQTEGYSYNVTSAKRDFLIFYFFKKYVNLKINMPPVLVLKVGNFNSYSGIVKVIIKNFITFVSILFSQAVNLSFFV
jgi:hypothetical protein